mmetsp:Transcript_43200/g.113766  ORF Transcript_43200/g.113766 Transcript_43200/m.113766 type:complete len:206 (-) Transcript_43200:18-635(-)
MCNSGAGGAAILFGRYSSAFVHPAHAPAGAVDALGAGARVEGAVAPHGHPHAGVAVLGVATESNALHAHRVARLPVDEPRRALGDVLGAWWQAHRHRPVDMGLLWDLDSVHVLREPSSKGEQACRSDGQEEFTNQRARVPAFEQGILVEERPEVALELSPLRLRLARRRSPVTSWQHASWTRPRKILISGPARGRAPRSAYAAAC